MFLYVLTMSMLLMVMGSQLGGINQINVIGYLDDLNSLSRHTSSVIDCLHGERGLRIKLFKTHAGSCADLSEPCSKVFERATGINNQSKIDDYIHNNTLLRGVVLYTDPQCSDLGRFKVLLSEHTLRIASLVFETTQISPEKIVNVNAHSDMVIVPDPWLVNVYKNSGIICPIFVLPLALDLAPLLTRPIKKQRNTTFTFGFSGLFLKNGRKNHELLMTAFAETFSGNQQVLLKLHGRSGGAFEEIASRFNERQTTNITFACKGLDRQAYEDFLASLDCYVTVSKGEGFSIIPREILALGIPCIVANNTAQATICATGFVRPIVSDVVEQALTHTGNWFNTDPLAIREALCDVYQHYGHYLNLAKKGREWVKQYLPENLTKKYKMLVEPSRVILGDRNEITDDYLMTDSPVLFAKYKKLYSCNKKMQFHIIGG